MTAGEPGPNTSYAPAPGRRLPAWVIGVCACAALPIAAVVLLAVIAGPSLRRIRERSREAVRGQSCMTNAGQLARALQMYAQDYDDHLPQASSWVTSTGRYIRTIPASRTPALRCPSVPGTDPSAIGYAFNAELSGKSRASVGALALARLVYDTTSKAPNASDAVTTLPNPPRHAQRQFRRASLPFNVIAYADGHVKAVNALGVALPAPQNRRGR